MAISIANGFGLEPSWLTTALRVLPEEPEVFAPSNINHAMLTFGIGNKKVEALGSWLRAASLCEGDIAGLRLTALGRLIKERDPELQSNSTWLVIHLSLALAGKSAGRRHELWQWYAAKNFPFGFTVESLRAAAAKDFPEAKPRTIRSGMDEVIKTLTSTPLGAIGLLQSDPLSGPGYLCKQPPAPGVITHAIMLAGVARQLEASGRDTLNFDELLEHENGAARVLNLPRSTMTAMLNAAQARIGSHLVSVTQTAGLDSVWLGERSVPFWLAWDYLEQQNGLHEATEDDVRQLLEA